MLQVRQSTVISSEKYSMNQYLHQGQTVRLDGAIHMAAR
jgi:hypothetical protein